MIKVLIVDDSPVVRKILTDELSRHRDIEVIGNAVNPYAARDKIVKLCPDVITLDIEMPKMDGLTFLSKLMKHFPMPVVVVSSLTPENSETALKALDLGAIEVLCKPGSAYSTKNISGDLARAIRAAASARVEARSEKQTQGVVKPQIGPIKFKTTHKIVAIGASTGGTKAIEAVLSGLPVTTPGTVIAQHMPETFTAGFAQRLNDVSPMEVREGRDNDHVIPGVALLAPGNHHMVLRRSGGNYVVRIKDGPLIHYQRPSVDVLFRSVAKSAGKNAVGVLLTGMGADGAKGLLEMRESGAYTIAQDEVTCVVFGMPKTAIGLGAVKKVVPLSDVSQMIIRTLQK